VIPTFLNLLASHLAAPAVLVMPDTDGGERYSLQCLNNPGGIQDMTYIAREVPLAVSRLVQVQPPGKAWGVAGYSEGGYCAANLALNEPGQYGYAGVISGYFKPFSSQIPAGGKPGARPVKANVFAKYPALALRNTPSAYITQVPIGVEVPLFWLAAGAGDSGDVQAAQSFKQLASIRQTDVPLDVLPGGHTGSVWRAALSPMLAWMTPQLAQQASIAAANAAHDARKPRVAGAKPGTKPGTGLKPGTRPTPPVKHATKP
jgi:enterochelin esterase-like enzyme